MAIGAAAAAAFTLGLRVCNALRTRLYPSYRAATPLGPLGGRGRGDGRTPEKKGGKRRELEEEEDPSVPGFDELNRRRANDGLICSPHCLAHLVRDLEVLPRCDAQERHWEEEEA